MAWSISGEYMETCNCTFLCPCLPSNMLERPTEGECKAAVALHIAKGAKDGVALDGLSFVVMIHSPGPMHDGNMTVGLIIDERATPAQAEAIAAIASGAAGGPMQALGPLVGRMAGIERRAIEFRSEGLTRSVRAGDLLDQACTGFPSLVEPGEPIAVSAVAHPVNTRLALARATRSLFKVFGIEWKDSSGSRNGHFAPFAWTG